MNVPLTPYPLPLSLKVGLISLGCAKNRVDSEFILGFLKDKCEVVADVNDANIVIINTCSFIEPAREETKSTINEMSELKKRGIIQKIIVCGCYPQRYGVVAAKEFPHVDFFLGTGNFNEIADVIDCVSFDVKTRITTPNFNYNKVYERVNSMAPYMAYLKISEGCDRTCSFCVIPNLRGEYRSRPIEIIISEATKLVESGVKEINLISEDTTFYGKDFGRKGELIRLLGELSEIKELKWIRLLYNYPKDLTDELIEYISTNDKIVKYFDLPCQHVNDRILKLMHRGMTKTEIIRKIDKIRKTVDNASVRAEFIVGFPSETQSEFDALCDFLKEAQFNYLGLFKYSNEEGTAAYKLDGQIMPQVKDARLQKILKIQEKLSQKIQKKLIGKIFDAIIINTDNEKYYVARLSIQAPEVDGVCYISNPPTGSYKIGDIASVKIIKGFDYDVEARIVN